MPDIDTPAARVLNSEETVLHSRSDSRVMRLALSKGSVSTAQAALSRMVGRGLQFSLPVLDADMRIHLNGDTGAAWTQPLALSGPSGMVEIADGGRWIRALTGIDLGTAGEMSQEWLQATALGRLAGTPLAGMDRVMPANQFVGSDIAVLRLGLHGSRHTLSTQARASVATWQEILSKGASSRLRSTSLAYLDFVIETTLLLARHRLPAFAVRRLAAGDVILPDSPGFSCDGSGSVRLGDMQLKVRCCSRHSLEIIALENILKVEELDGFVESQVVAPAAGSHEELAKSENGIDSSSGPYRLSKIDQLDAVPLTLVFELGKVSIALADLRALGPQAILSVKGGSAASIAIVCSGRTLGRGEAVDVDGVLGIRITHWGESC